MFENTQKILDILNKFCIAQQQKGWDKFGGCEYCPAKEICSGITWERAEEELHQIDENLKVIQ